MKFGMDFGTHFEIGIYPKLLVVTIAALNSCPSSKRVLGQALSSSDHQIFTNPEFQSKWKRRATPFGPGYIEYQLDLIWIGPSWWAKCLRCKPLVKLLHSPGVAFIIPSIVLQVFNFIFWSPDAKTLILRCGPQLRRICRRRSRHCRMRYFMTPGKFFSAPENSGC